MHRIQQYVRKFEKLHGGRKMLAVRRFVNEVLRGGTKILLNQDDRNPTERLFNVQTPLPLGTPVIINKPSLQRFHNLHGIIKGHTTDNLKAIRLYRIFIPLKGSSRWLLRSDFTLLRKITVFVTKIPQGSKAQFEASSFRELIQKVQKKFGKGGRLVLEGRFMIHSDWNTQLENLPTLHYVLS